MDNSSLRRWFLAVALVIVLPFAWLGPLDPLAQEHVESGLKRALVTFAAARAANAVISVVQETEFAISPLGIGTTVKPAQILDPLNDVVEQFSTLMLIASVSFGVQSVLISLGGATLVSALLSSALLGWGWFVWRERAPPEWLNRVVLMLLLVRFVVPVAGLGSEETFRLLMAREYDRAQQQISVSSTEMNALTPSGEAGTRESFLDQWKKSPDLRQTYTRLKDKAEGMVRHIVTLMALFAVQTLLLPLVFLWFVHRAFHALLFASRPRALHAHAEGVAA